jgi:hypothetical protein
MVAGCKRGCQLTAAAMLQGHPSAAEGFCYAMTVYIL